MLTKNCWMSLKQDTIKKQLQEGEKAVTVLGYEDYYVTNFGRVFSAKKKFTHETLNNVVYGCVAWKELKPFYTHRYKTVTLVKKGKKKNVYIHTLVYEQFKGVYDKHYFKVVFKNKDMEDCNIDNLELEFKNKSKRNIENYKKQQSILDALNIYDTPVSLENY